MSYLNYEFFDEFKSLDSICRDIYGKSIDNKLGVTLYLEDMNRNSYRGSIVVPGWTSDYYKLKSARNIRNELAHSRNSFSAAMCSQDDIDFIRSFKTRILNQTDPIAMLKKLTNQSHHASVSSSKQQPLTTYNKVQQRRTPSGCLVVAAFVLIVLAYIIAIIL